MKLIIIAAGKGSRMQPMSNGIPKTLLNVYNKRIIDYIIDNCVEVGIKECVVVTGYKEKEVLSYLKKVNNGISIETVHNHDWKLPNGLSVLTAKNSIPEGEDFLITMSDHLYGASLLKKIKDSPLDKTTVNVGLDFNIENIFDIADGMKVKVDPSNPAIVTAMSKNLMNYDAIDCGVFKCGYDFFHTLERAKKRKTYALSDACNILINEKVLGSVNIENDFWIDIDIPESIQFLKDNDFSTRVTVQA